MARNKAPSVRQLRVGEKLRHALAEILARGELRDPVLRGITLTVTEIRASPDLKQATVFVTPLGVEEDEAILDALGRAGKFLRGQLARALRLKFTPQLRFAFDDRFAHATHIDDLLRRPDVMRDLADGESEDGAA